MRKAFLEKAVVELVYKFDEKSYRECEKVSRSLKYVRFKIIFVHKHIYIYMDTNTDHFTPLVLHVRVNYNDPEES